MWPAGKDIACGHQIVAALKTKLFFGPENRRGVVRGRGHEPRAVSAVVGGAENFDGDVTIRQCARRPRYVAARRG